MGNIPTSPPFGTDYMGLTPPPPPSYFPSFSTFTRPGEINNWVAPISTKRKCSYCGQMTEPDSLGACPCCAGHSWEDPNKELAKALLKSRLGPLVAY